MKHLFGVFLILILLLPVASANASLQSYTIEELSKLAKYVIIGEITLVKPVIPDHKATLSDDPDAFLYDVTMNVEKDLTNQYENDTIKFRIMSNRDLDPYSKSIEDSQEFQIGERVLVFLADKEPESIWGDNYYVAGITMGKYILDEGLGYGTHYNGIQEDELISKIQQSRFQYPIPGSGIIKEMAPLKQFKSGIPIHEIKCKKDLVFAVKANNGNPVCVKLETKIKLIQRGWADDTIKTETPKTSAIQCNKEPDPNFRGSSDDWYLMIESSIPGYAGHFLDDKRRLAVYVTELERFSADDIRSGLCGYVPSELLERDIVILKAPQGWSKWVEYGNKISPAIFDRGFGVTMFDIDEKVQKIVIGIKKDGFEINKEKVVQFLNANDIPLGFVDIVEADPATFD